MKRLSFGVLTLSMSFVCGGCPPTPATIPAVRPPSSAVAAKNVAPSSESEKLAADSSRSTARGTTFTAPKDWTLKSEGGRRILEGPESGIRIAIVDATATSADAAVAEAWAAFAPAFKRPPKLVQSKPGRQGWDERREYEYETSPNERMIFNAIALRQGEAWTAAVTESTEPAFERREAQVRLVMSAVRPAGYTRESFKGRAAKPLDTNRINELGAFIDKARDEAGIPGVGLALVQGGKPVFVGGFGERELGKPAKVDGDTLFMIASNTKGLTTLMLAKLVDEGRFKWDAPVTTIWPAFKLGDAETTRKVQMKHLVCACTGLPRQDYEWLFEFKTQTPKSEMDLLGTFQPTTKFGEVFQYSNLLAAAAGYAGAYAIDPKVELGAAYDEAMKKRVFEPLGMKATTFDFATAARANHATAYADDWEGKPAPAKHDINRAAIPLRPAGGAWSSARDLVKYVQMELANGKLPNGTRYIGEDALLARRTPFVAAGEDEVYGMGLEVNTKYGVTLVHHGGALFGYMSDMFWLPDHDVGGVILTNADNGRPLLGAFEHRLLEVLFDGYPEAAEDFSASIKQYRSELVKERARITIPADQAAAAKLAKRYKNDTLGDISVRAKEKATIFDFGEWSTTVASRKNDDGTLSFVTADPSIMDLAFVVAERDGERALVVRDGQHEYTFIEVKE